MGRNRAKIASLIAKVKRQRKVLDEILSDLYEIEESAVLMASPAVSLDDHEKSLIARARSRAGGNQSEAANFLGISRDRLRSKLRKYNLR